MLRLIFCTLDHIQIDGKKWMAQKYVSSKEGIHFEIKFFSGDKAIQKGSWEFTVGPKIIWDFL